MEHQIILKSKETPNSFTQNPQRQCVWKKHVEKAKEGGIKTFMKI